MVRLAVDVLPLGPRRAAARGCAAIIVSTANSMLLSPATSLVRDVYQRFLNPAAPASHIVFATRIAIVALGAIGLVASSFFPTVLSMALWAYTMYGAGITPALIAALVWPARDAPGRHLVDRRGHVDHVAVGDRRPGARERGRAALSARDPDDLPGAGCSLGVLIALTLTSAPRRVV